MNDARISLTIEQERSEHEPQIERLLHLAFGPGRFAKTAERLREGNTAIAELCLVAFENATMRASVRFWPIFIGETPALLLGPLAVDPDHRGKKHRRSPHGNRFGQGKRLGTPHRHTGR